MNQNQPLSFSLRVMLGLAAFGLMLFLMREAAEVINALLLGYIIVLSASPLMYWLQSKNAPDWLAYVVTLLAIVIVFGSLIVLLVVAVDKLIESIPTYAEELESTIAGIEEFLVGLGLTSDSVDRFFKLVDPANLLGLAGQFLAGLAGTLSNVLLIGLIVVFLLVDAFGIPAKLQREIREGNKYVERVATFSSDIREYVYITTIVGLITGVLDTVFFMIMGVDFAVLWGILAFLLSYVPTIGFWLAAIPPTFLAWLESGALAGLAVFLGIVLINGFAETVVKPKYMGSGLNLSAFVVVFSVVFWSGILGALGAILSIPMTLIFKELVFEMDDENRWIARLMSADSNEDAPPEPEAEEVAASAD